MNQSEFFDKCAETWDSIEVEDIRARLDRVVAEAEIKPGMRILDVGTGTGALIPSLIEAIQAVGHIRAIDVSRGMLRVAKSKDFPDIVEFFQEDMHSIDLPDACFDCVMCNAVFPHFEDKPKALAQAMRLLKPGGTLIISHPTGREAVNKIHREAGDVVAEDRVPTSNVMHSTLTQAGFQVLYVRDEPEFYLAKARKA